MKISIGKYSSFLAITSDISVWKVYEIYQSLPEFSELVEAADDMRTLGLSEIGDYAEELSRKFGVELNIGDALRIGVISLKRSIAYEEAKYTMGMKSFVQKDLKLWFPHGSDDAIYVRPALSYNIALLYRLAGDRSQLRYEGLREVLSPTVDRDRLEEAVEILRPHQREALEVLRKTRYYGSVQIPTGGGKTLIGAIAAAELRVPLIVVAPREDILKEWRRHLLFVGFNEANIGFLTGKKKEIGKPILLTTYNSLYLRRNELMKYVYKLLILDEAHRAPAKTFALGVLSVPSIYRIGLSATFWRDEPANNRLSMMLAPLIYEVSPSLLIEIGALAKPKVTFACAEMTDADVEAIIEAVSEAIASAEAKFVKRIEVGNEVTYQVIDERRLSKRLESFVNSVITRISNAVARCEGKVKKAVEIARRHANEKVIVFSEFTSIARRIYEELVSEGTQAWLYLDSKDVLEKFTKATSGVLVTAKKADEGINVPDASIGIIVASRTKFQTREFIQRMGRILRVSEGKERANIYVLVCEPRPVDFTRVISLVKAVAEKLVTIRVNSKEYTSYDFVKYFERKLARTLCRDKQMAENYLKLISNENIEVAIECDKDPFDVISCIRELTQ